jgi:H+/Cl- antiporter ClcA
VPASFDRQVLNQTIVHIRRGLGPGVLAVGVGGGLIGALYVATLHLLQRSIGPGVHSAGAQVGILAAAGLGVALLTRLGGETGDVELLVDNIHVLGGAEDIRRLRSLVPASLLCVASGGGMGPEAPLVQSTGAFGTWVATRLHRPISDVRILTITGMAAAFTVLFGAPLGSALFALEILHRRGLQYYEALLPAVLGSLCGYAVYLGLNGTGIGPVWTFPPVERLHAVDLITAVGVGVAGAAGAAIFATTIHFARKAFAILPRSPRYVVGGLALGLLGIWSPFALTFGEAQLSQTLDLRLTVGALAVAVAAKLLGTTVTVAAGWKGGFIIPLFFMGATLGQLAHHALPGTNETVLMAGLMVALCVGVTKTPIGTTLVVTEMTGMSLLPVTIIAAVVALMLTSPVTIIETQRSREDHTLAAL